MMKHMKKLLSLMLVLCMVLSLGPTSALAGNIVSDTETSVAEQAEDVKTNSDAVREENHTAINTLSLDEDDGIAALALTIGSKPEDGTTNSQPFSRGTGGSTNFRIPALVTLNNGTLVAAADARWNQIGDGWGLDTIVSRSSNSGQTWNYTFANYLGDNDNEYNSDSTAFIDPALAVNSDDTIYMLVDLYPHGTYIGNVKAGTGFDSNGHLLLRTSSGSSYDYYVGDFTGGKASIYSKNGTEVSGYTVDEYYNIKSTDGRIDTNLFFSDSPYQVLSTSYLYLTTSTDGGVTWSAPLMLNSQVKNSDDMFYGVGPGRGLVTTLSNGTERIIFPCYTYTTQDGNTSVIYSDDDGKTWTRSADMSVQSSEAALVEADGKIYMFTRHGGYYVSLDNGATWGSQQSVSDISYTTSCQLSAITYSKKIDGKTAILLSAPTSDRTTGKIFVGLVQDDGSISWKYTYSVNSNNYYAYSCLTELNNGSIGLLYENASGSITYANFAITDIAASATISDSTETPDNFDSTESKEENITLYVGQSKTVTDSTGNYKENYTGAGLDTSIATVEVTGTTVEGGTTKSLGSTISMSSDGIYTGVISDGTNYLVLNGNQISSTTDINEATEWTVTRSGSSRSSSYTVKSGSYYLSRSNNLLSASTSNSNWSYSDGFCYISGRSTYYLRYSNGWTLYTTNSNKGQLYSVTTSSIEPVDATTISILGVTVGTTSVTVGNTQYNITVLEAPDYVNATNTPFTVGSSHTGAGGILTKLTLSVGLTYDVDLVNDYSGGTWSIADTSIATVDQDGKVTGVSAGETTLTYTASDGSTYTIPVVIVQNTTSSSTKICSLHITEITNTAVWYSWNCSGSTDEFIEAVNGEAIYVSYASTDSYCINFYGAPAEGYALTFMSATNSSGNYLALDDKDDPTGCDFYTENGAGKNERNNTEAFGDAKVKADIQAALDLGCDGAQGFSRTSTDSNSTNCDLTFRSQKLPTVDKTIATVGGESYTEGMTAKAGDVIVYNITVTQYATTEEIVYTNVILTDELTDAVFSGTTSNVKTITDLSNSTLASNRITTYQVIYQIQDSDLDKDIINKVSLNYNYSSAFSSGTFGGSASAQAQISAPTFTPDDIVIDFGLPVVIDYSGENAHGRYDLVSGSATYGKVSVENNKVTYTPTKVLQGVDTVTLTNTAGGKYTFNVYPATTVYYEENFAELSDGSTSGFVQNGTSKNTTQTTQIAGKSSDVYGYDASYADDSVGASNGTEAVSNVKGAATTFTFTGTGVDIYANCSGSTGKVSIQIKNKSGATVKLITVDTSSNSSLYSEYSGEEYSLPVVSVTGLEHGTYTVKLVQTTADTTVRFDGFRVYGTLIDSRNSVYVNDLEDNPTFLELRDYVLTALEVNNETSSAGVYAQVREVTNDTLTGVVLNKSGDSNSSYDGAELLQNGPKNELFLLPGESVVFKLTTKRQVQIGLKAVNGAVAVSGSWTGSISSSTDMFYTVAGKRASETEQTITITNSSSSNGILSVTKVKICDDPNVVFSELTEDDFSDALVSLGITEVEEEPQPTEPEVTYADAILTVQVNDVTTVLTQNGIVGENATFTAAEIEEAAAGVVADGYELSDVSYSDVVVAYGESDTVSFTATEKETPTTPDEGTNNSSSSSSLLNKIVNIIKSIFGKR